MMNEEAKRNLVYAKRWGDKPDDEALEIAIEAIEALESQRWIPVSEGHPKKGQWCLVTTKWGETRPWLYYVQTDVWDEYVVRWMPLPEPYTESEVDVQ